MFTHKHDAYRVYLTFAALWSLALRLAFTVFMIYLVYEMKLNPLQLVLTGTAMELTAFLTEVPTGVVADVYSRRLSVIIGMVLMGISFLVFTIPSFPVILFSQMILAVGWTFVSGAESAWITDEIGENAAGRAFLRRSQVEQGIKIIAIVFSIALALVNLRLPIILASCVYFLNALYLIGYMPETGFHPAPRDERETFGSMIRTTREGIQTIRGRPVLITLMAIIFVFGAFSEGFDRLWTFHLLENFRLPTIGLFQFIQNINPQRAEEFNIILWIGLISIVASIFGMTLTEVARRRVDTADPVAIAKALTWFSSTLIVALIVFALAGQFALAMIAYWIVGTMRNITVPLRDAWINQGLNPRVRATVISMTSQMDAIGQISGGPAIGMIGNRFGVRIALGLSAMILTPVLGLYRRTIRQNGRIGAVVNPIVEAPVVPGD